MKKSNDPQKNSKSRGSSSLHLAGTNVRTVVLSIGEKDLLEKDILDYGT